MSSLRRKVTPSDISALEALLAPHATKVLSPTSPGYEASIYRWSRAAEKPAGVCILPTSTTDLSIALRYANEQNLEVAVKCGGHSTAGASSTDGGMLVDLGGMRGVGVDAERKVLRVQGGCNWGDVDAAAWEHGLATVGGTVNDTGVGGLALGGGYGMLSGTHGLVIDNMISATVVLADGEVVEASETRNEELFWALRGAGQNFGVVTEFVLKAYEVGEAWMGMMVFPPTEEKIREVVAATNELFTVREQSDGKRGTRATGRSLAMTALTNNPENGEAILMVAAFFNGTEEDGKKVFKPFLDLEPMLNTMAMHDYPMANKFLSPPYGMRSSMKGAAFKLPIQPEFVMDLKKQFEELQAIDESLKCMLAFELYDPVVVTSNSAGSFANRGEHLNALVMPLWTRPELDITARKWARDVNMLFKKELELKGDEAGHGINGSVGIRGKKGAVLLYGNYDQYDEKSKDIFGEHYPRLQKLKARYDPTNMFNKLFPIYPEA